MDVAARQAFLDEEDGWAGAILVEPLTALAGGIIGGVTVAVIAWRIAMKAMQ